MMFMSAKTSLSQIRKTLYASWSQRVATHEENKQYFYYLKSIDIERASLFS